MTESQVRMTSGPPTMPERADYRADGPAPRSPDQRVVQITTNSLAARLSPVDSVANCTAAPLPLPSASK
jgi:hypothetical protein